MHHCSYCSTDAGSPQLDTAAWAAGDNLENAVCLRTWSSAAFCALLIAMNGPTIGKYSAAPRKVVQTDTCGAAVPSCGATVGVPAAAGLMLQSGFDEECAVAAATSVAGRADTDSGPAPVMKSPLPVCRSDVKRKCGLAERAPTLARHAVGGTSCSICSAGLQLSAAL